MSLKMRRVLSVLLLLLSLLLSSAVPGLLTERPTALAPSSASRESYVNHEPIEIDNRVDFAGYGIPGAGSESEPYVIEDWHVDTTTSFQWCIRILLQDLDIHLVLRDCLFESQAGCLDVRVHGSLRIERCVILGECNIRNMVQFDFLESSLEIGTLDIYGAENCRIVGNIFVNADAYAVDCNAAMATVANNTFTDCDLGVGTWWPGSYNVTRNAFTRTALGVFCNGASTYVAENNFTSGETALSVAGVLAENNRISNYTTALHLFVNGGHVTFRHNTVSNVSVGIEGYRSFECNISDNDIEVTGPYAMDLDRCRQMRISDNRMIGGTIRIENYSALADSMVLEGNTVNGLDFLVMVNRQNIEVLGTEIAQGFLVGCKNCTITGGLFEDLPVAIALYNSQGLTVRGIEVTGCARGLDIESTTSTHIENCAFVSSGLDIYGMELAHYNHTTSNVTLNGGPVAFIHGLSNETFYLDSYAQVLFFGGENVDLVGEYMEPGSTGVTIAGCSNYTLSGMAIGNFTRRGLLLFGSTNCTISSNTFEDNAEALAVVSCTHCVIRNNTFTGNAAGIHMGDPTSLYRPVANFVFYNRFSGNTLHAWDQECGNKWDDGVSMGNWWAPYSGGCVVIPSYGITYDMESNFTKPLDRFPNGLVGDPFAPVIIGPPDESVLEGREKLTIEWDVRDRYLGYYYIYVNSTLVKWEMCKLYAPPIYLTLWNLTRGFYNVTLVAMDMSCNVAVDTVFVYVTAGTSTTQGTDEGLASFALVISGTAAAALVTVIGVHLYLKKKGAPG